MLTQQQQQQRDSCEGWDLRFEAVRKEGSVSGVAECVRVRVCEAVLLCLYVPRSVGL